MGRTGRLRAAISAALFVGLITACATGDPGHRLVPRSPFPDPSGNLAGTYFFASRQPSGATVGGRMTLTRLAASYDVVWIENGEEAAKGMAVQVADVLAVVKGKTPRDFWNDYMELGLAVFDIRGDELWGTRVFADDPLRRADTQHLRRVKGSTDRYDIVPQDGRAATTAPAQVKITRNGDAYLFAWYDPQPTFIGTGVRLGNRYIVGLTSTNLPTVLALCRVGDTLRGVGVANSGERLSEETLRVAGRFWLSDDLESESCTGWLAAHGIP